MNIELIRNTIYKAYLEDFYRYCKELGGATAEIMSELLEVLVQHRTVTTKVLTRLNLQNTSLKLTEEQSILP